LGTGKDGREVEAFFIRLHEQQTTYSRAKKRTSPENHKRGLLAYLEVEALAFLSSVRKLRLQKVLANCLQEGQL
jgi:hypothetical protein